MEVLYRSGMRFIGRTFGGERVFVEAEIRRCERDAFTVSHEMIAEYTEVSFHGETYEKHCRNVSGCGQIRTTLNSIVKPAKPLDMLDVFSINRMWHRYHLSGMQAACVHMPGNAHELWTKRERVVCEQSGYSYGSRWLVKPVPEETLTEIRRIMDKAAVK